MNIHFEPLIINVALAQQIAYWYNDPEISPFVQPTFTESEPHHFTVQDVLDQHHPNPKILKYLIMDDDFAIGEFSITKDFHWLLGPNEDTAWISICIGEKSYWGKGISKITMRTIEEMCKTLGYKRIELGVFENNHKAHQLYLKMGYVQFAKTEHMTYSQGAWRTDLRMEKYL
jgi:RimJ/RimL family protein N-acetyltransferase